MRQMTFRGSLVARAVTWLAVFLALLLITGDPAVAGVVPYTAQEVFRVHQNKFDVAHDLTIKFWQKEDDVHIKSWDVLGTSGGLPAPSSKAPGEQPGDHHTKVEKLHGSPKPGDNPDDGSHAVDLKWVGLNIPRCTTVDVEFRWTLTEYNTKRHVVTWSEDPPGGAPAVAKAGPNMGWTVSDPVKVGADWVHTVTIANDDDPGDSSSASFLLNDLKYWVLPNNDYLDIGALQTWSSWSVPFADMVLDPGQSYSFQVMSVNANQRILGAFNALDPTSRDFLMSDTFDHTSVPEPSSMLLCTIGCGGIALVWRRTRR